MRVRPAVLLAAVLPLLTGCATLRATLGGWERGPDGISLSQHRLREALSRGDFDAALAWREDDALLRALTAGAASYYAAQYAHSGAILDSAALLADDRITASISKNALSLLTNDMARPYQPRRTERLFVAYYGMLSFAQLGAWEDAAVEARRMVGLLAQYQDGREAAEQPLHAAMEYLAGAVFEHAGERGAAAVAYRAARAMAGTLSDEGQAQSGGDGEVLVVVERGFVAHRTTETISIRLEDEERDSIRSERVWGRVARRFAQRIDGHEERIPSAATGPLLVPATASQDAVEVSPGATSGFRQPADQLPRIVPRRHRHRDDDDDFSQLSIAFPRLRRTAPSWPGELRLIADGASTPKVRLAASVDDASAVDERRERLGFVMRAVARAATKYAVTRAVKDEKGEVAGTIAELGANLLERADVRSWHLLPQRLELIRLRMPPGRRVLWLEVGGGSTARQLQIPNVAVKAGGVTIVPVRIWRDAQLGTVSTDTVPSGCVLLECR
jgi:hypothetical protein